MDKHQFSKTQQRLHFKICLFLIALIPFMSDTSKASSNAEETPIEDSEKESPKVIRFSLTKSRKFYQNKTPSSESGFENQSNLPTIHKTFGKYGGLTPNRKGRSMHAANKDAYDNAAPITDSSKTDDEKKHFYSAVFPSLPNRTSKDDIAPSKTLPIIFESNEDDDAGE